MGNDERLTAKQFQQSGGVEDWRVLAFGVSAWFDAPSHTAGAALVRRVAELAGGTDRLPDMDLRARGVHVRIRAGDSPGLTLADAEFARAISAAAQELGLAADPSAVQTVQLGIDVLDKAAVLPFWRTALGYEQLGEDDLVDPMRRDPAIWFQQQDQPRPLRNRIHVDVVRPDALTMEGVTAIGGRAGGVSGATPADAEGNEACLIPLAPVDGLGEEPEPGDWRGPFVAMTFYPTTSFPQSAELAGAAAGLADEIGKPLLVDLRPDGVTIDSGKDEWEGDDFGLDERFGDLARRTQATARGMGLTADTTRLRFMQIGIDAVDIPAVRGFWRAVLGYEDHRYGDIYDPRRLNPPIFFQQMEASEEDRRKQRNRIHVDVFVPDDQARARIDSALAAGGRIVYDDKAPEWWTLADPEGNEADIAVSVGREELWLAAQAAAD